MGKKKNEAAKQIGFRVPVDLANRLEECAEMLAVDVSALLRLLIVELLPVIEARARKARGLPQGDGPLAHGAEVKTLRGSP